MAIDLGAEPSSVPVARHWVCDRARDAGASAEAVDTLALITSELVTNAVKFGPDLGSIRVEAEREDDQFRVQVSDESHEAPIAQHLGVGRIGGHGVRLVQGLASQWGVELHDGDGKTVSFLMPLTRKGSVPAGPV